MSTSSETGHAKNVSNLQTLITYVESLGEKYTPFKTSLKLDALKALYAAVTKSMDDFASVKPAYSAAVDAQEAAFKPLDKLVTRVVSAYKSGVDDPARADTIQSLKRQMTHSYKTKKATPATNGETPAAAPAHHTIRHSYDSRLGQFSDIVKVLEATPDYQPLEDELKVATLKAVYAELLQKTQTVDAAQAPVVNARISRNKTLYDTKTGLYDVVLGVKDYVVAVFGSSSPQVKYINQLKFKKQIAS